MTQNEQPRLTLPADQWGEMRKLLMRNLDALGDIPAPEPVPKLSADFREASSEMDMALGAIRGAVFVLSQLAYQGELLSGPSDEAGAINTMIDLLETRVAEVTEIHNRIWIAAGGE